MRAKDISFFGLVVVVLLVAGCTEERGMADRVPYSVHDSSGVELVFNRSPLWQPDAGWSLASEPSVVVGPAVGADRYLYRVGDIERFEDGRLIVENRGTQEVFVFDSTGVFLGSWGGPGQGPGEFSKMMRMFRCGEDQLAEFESRRVTILDSQGNLLSTTPLPQEVVGGGKRVWGVGKDCGRVLVTGLVRDSEPTGLGTFHNPAMAFRVSLGSPAVDTIGTVLGLEWVGDRSGNQRALFPFAFKSNWASDGSNVYYGWGDRPEVKVMSLDGRMLRLVRWDVPPVPITEADWDSYEADVRSFAQRMPGAASTNLPREEHPRPTVKPYFGPPDASGSAFLVSDDGHLWVRRFTRYLVRDRDSPMLPVRWWVFDRVGRWLGEVETPEGFEVRNVQGNFVLGVSRTFLGVEEVRVYRIVGRSD